MSNLGTPFIRLILKQWQQIQSPNTVVSNCNDHDQPHSTTSLRHISTSRARACAWPMSYLRRNARSYVSYSKTSASYNCLLCPHTMRVKLRIHPYVHGITLSAFYKCYSRIVSIEPSADLCDHIAPSSYLASNWSQGRNKLRVSRHTTSPLPSNIETWERVIALPVTLTSKDAVHLIPEVSKQMRTYIAHTSHIALFSISLREFYMRPYKTDKCIENPYCAITLHL